MRRPRDWPTSAVRIVTACFDAWPARSLATTFAFASPGFVTRAVRPRCKNGSAVVVSKVSEGFVQGGLITAAFGYRRFQVIRDDSVENTPDIMQGVLTGHNEVLLLLGEHSFHIGELARSQDGYKDLYFGDLTGILIGDT